MNNRGGNSNGHAQNGTTKTAQSAELHEEAVPVFPACQASDETPGRYELEQKSS